MGAEFLAMLLVVVYVGAVAVLFLFVVMMLDVDFAALRQGFAQYLPFGLLVAGVLAVEMVLVSVSGRHHAARRRPRRRWPMARRPDVTNTEAIGRVLYTDYVYFFQAAGLVLLVAMIGAIVLTLRHKPGVAPEHRRPGRAHAQDRHAHRQIKSGQGIDGMTIGLAHYLAVAAILFTIGVFGIFVNRKNVIVILMSIELILLAVNINLVAFSVYPARRRRADLRHVRADRRRGRGGRRPGDPGDLLPQPRRHRRRRRQHDEGLTRK
jgi:NADH-quinone oxidoreductase subunit J